MGKGGGEKFSRGFKYGGQHIFWSLKYGGLEFFEVEKVGAIILFGLWNRGASSFFNRQIPQNPAWVPGKFWTVPSFSPGHKTTMIGSYEPLSSYSLCFKGVDVQISVKKSIVSKYEIYMFGKVAGEL